MWTGIRGRSSSTAVHPTRLELAPSYISSLTIFISALHLVRGEGPAAVLLMFVLRRQRAISRPLWPSLHRPTVLLSRRRQLLPLRRRRATRTAASQTCHFSTEPIFLDRLTI